MENFRLMVTNLYLQDLGFNGTEFTWTNRRAGEDNIQVHLDRALANPHVLHLPRYKSDHCPILVQCNDQQGCIGSRRKKKQKKFRFEKMWLEKEAYGDIVNRGWNQGMVDLPFTKRTKGCGSYLRLWDEVTFDNISKKIKKLKKVLEALQTCPQTEDTIQLIDAKTKELVDLLKNEEIL
ncbi:hypothetical protein ACS0TY_006114 [Phlomoides rotata]